MNLMLFASTTIFIIGFGLFVGFASEILLLIEIGLSMIKLLQLFLE